MEGVGARLGRSSTRYGPATVFSGPVRKWTKKWVPLSNPNSNASSHAALNGAAATNNNHSHLLLYKWTPISSQANGGGAAAASATGKDVSAATAVPATQLEEPPRRKFRYVPISVIEEQKQEAAVKSEEENKPHDADASAQRVQANQSDGKPYMNDASMEEAQATGKDQAPAKDKGTDLNLSLGLNVPDDDGESDLKRAEQGDGTGKLDKVKSGEDVEMKSATDSETDNKLKRKAVTPDLEMRV
ncbi:hypothetical protein COCNU_11G010890 [Cocos nucifera]|uniref:Uncharacterized protein n=1 Tax=Cocos nucifera TaxID=13894 RepID=A0A8K0IPL3_COCNU|nr:hypothetical protein COCNU_11G010890 [Cocos nucifera]